MYLRFLKEGNYVLGLKFTESLTTDQLHLGVYTYVEDLTIRILDVADGGQLHNVTEHIILVTNSSVT